MTFAAGQGYKLTEVYTNGKLDPYASCRAAGEFFTTTWEAVDELIFVKLRICTTIPTGYVLSLPTSRIPM